MFGKVFAAITTASLVAFVSAECPNACSSHGKCGAYDMCICYRNWMSNDCSERVCPFGLAHVDTPKGDLDASSGKLSGPDTTVITNDAVYPYGAEEQFPSMYDTEGNVMSNSAHWWSECSNKGICDRQTGTCACFDGYAGANCQRADCPVSSAGVCSGHGVCETIREIARRDNNNVYNLWDQDATMGCVCDGGYTGADCSERICKYGSDPLYYDDYANVRIANFTYQIYTTTSTSITGNYSIFFQDRTGEDWETGPISITADCDDVTDALEALPNNVIPSGSVRCHQFSSTEVLTQKTNGDVDVNAIIGGSNSVVPKFTLAFPANPGYIKQISINKYLDGSRPTLYTAESSTSTLAWHIFVNGFSGEDTDYVPDHCEGVLVTLSTTGSGYHKLAGLGTQETKKLKKCLGDSDGESTTYQDEVYNWDYGNENRSVPITTYNTVHYWNELQNPHLIKLIDATETQNKDSTTIWEDHALWPYPKTMLCSKIDNSPRTSVTTGLPGWCANRQPAGFYAVLYYESSEFRILTRAAADYGSGTLFHVFTTTGFLRRVSPISMAFSTTRQIETQWSITDRIASYHGKVMYLTNVTGTSKGGTAYPSDFFGEVDCETSPIGTNAAADCLNKGDLVMFLNTDRDATGLAANPIYPNIYTVEKIYRAEKDPWNSAGGNYAQERSRNRIVLNYGMNTKFNFEAPAAIYKFHPPAGYNYVGQCSNRGLCNQETGLCDCFAGYTGDDCGQQNALAV